MWTPDGTRVVFSSKRPTNYRVFRKMVDGTGEEEPIQVPPGDVYVEHLSPDQRYITASILRNGLWIIPLARRPEAVAVPRRRPRDGVAVGVLARRPLAGVHVRGV